ncbi:MAG: hypothetical protein WCF24_05600 [Acidimicrobiales bacterium]
MGVQTRFETSAERLARLDYEARRADRDARIAAAIAANVPHVVPKVPSWRWLTEDQAAGRWRIATRTMRDRRVRWGIPATKAGRSWIYHPIVFEAVDEIVMTFLSDSENKEPAGVVGAA